MRPGEASTTSQSPAKTAPAAADVGAAVPGAVPSASPSSQPGMHTPDVTKKLPGRIAEATRPRPAIVASSKQVEQAKATSNVDQSSGGLPSSGGSPLQASPSTNRNRDVRHSAGTFK